MTDQLKEPGIAYAIYEKVKDLPAADQAEILRLVDRVSQGQATGFGARARAEDQNWAYLSLASALRGLEDDAWPDYAPEDLLEDWTCPSPGR